MDAVFDRACERCGTYAPLSSKYGPELCADCIERTAHPIVRTGSGVADILIGVSQLLRTVGVPAALIVTLAGLPISIIQYLVPDLSFLVSMFWEFFVGTLAEMVVLHLAWQAIAKREQRISLGAALSAIGRGFGSLLGTRLLCILVISLFTLLLVLPGVFKVLSLTIAMPIALHEGSDASDAIVSSTARMQGHRADAFFAYCLAGAPFFVLFVAIICLASAQGFAQGLDPPEANWAPSEFYDFAMLALGIATPAALVPVTLVPAVLYAKLRQPE